MALTRGSDRPVVFASLLTVWSVTRYAVGLLRHYWVVVKLLITIPATLVLLVHMQPISFLADAAVRRN